MTEMNGFYLANRPLKVGPAAKKSTSEKALLESQSQEMMPMQRPQQGVGVSQTISQMSQPTRQVGSQQQQQQQQQQPKTLLPTQPFTGTPSVGENNTLFVGGVDSMLTSDVLRS